MDLMTSAPREPKKICARRLWSMGAIALTVAITLSGQLNQADAAPVFPTHRCGSFRHHIGGAYPATYRIVVLNALVKCRVAGALIKAFWTKDRSTGNKTIEHGGPSTVSTYWTIKGWPGWRCGLGAGAGLCHRHSKVAAYEVQVTRPATSASTEVSLRRPDEVD